MPKALVYRSAACDEDEDTSKAVAHLLKTCPYKFSVQYCGPNEDIDFDADGLDGVDLFAVPGGPDLDDAYEEMKDGAEDLRDWIRSGGRYLGFCLGAYLCGRTPGFRILPKGADADSECEQPGAQVSDDADSITQIDWTWASGRNAGQTSRNQWVYFQEGPCLTDFKEGEDAYVLARYSKGGRVAATLSAFGRGWVGCVGPHPEADQDWCMLQGVVGSTKLLTCLS
jgi:glutamine amidotransferase-like uncharacterized protein